jgi:hypothetical protein
MEVKLTALPFSSPPELKREYKVGDVVEVNCDHENEHNERVRDWLKGVVVQVDAKLVAVQFHYNVYLTNGWMIPDHVLWSPKESSNIRRPKKRRR